MTYWNNKNLWACALLLSGSISQTTIAQDDYDEPEVDGEQLQDIEVDAPQLEQEEYEWNPMIEEVMVTARKREESLQEVPIAITAFTDSAMESRGFTSVEDIAASTPGFSFESFSTGGTYGNPVIRGLTNTFTTSRVQNVSFFLDGIYLQRQSMLNTGLIDMERIEVVKGPQSAAYGRNAFAGAVNYITSRIEAEPKGYVKVTQGDNERQDIQASISGPIFGSPAFLGKLSVGNTVYDGHTKNYHPLADIDVSGPSTYQNLGGYDDETISMRLIWAPMETMEVAFGYYSTEAEREPTSFYTMSGYGATRFGFRTQDQNDLNCNYFYGATTAGEPVEGYTAWCGEIPYKTPLYTPGSDPFNPNRNNARAHNIKDANGNVVGHFANSVDPRGIGALLDTEVMTLKMDWEINENWTVHYLFGFTDHTSFTNGGSGDDDSTLGTRVPWFSSEDGDGIRTEYVHANTFSGRPNSDLDATSHEIRVDWAGNDKWLATFGVYYSKVEDEQWETLFLLPTCSNIDTPGGPDPVGSTDEVNNCLLEADGLGNSAVGLAYIAEDTVNGGPELIAQAAAAYEADTSTDKRDYDDYLIWWIGNNSGYSAATLDFARQHDIRLSQSVAEDDVKSIFATTSYIFNDDLELTVEARYTQEDKEFFRIADQFGQTETSGQVSVLANTVLIDEFQDKKTFKYFTPRFSLEWNINDEQFAYLTVARGIKTGGFNIVSPDAAEQASLLGVDQSSYDTEENVNYEIGLKNTLMGGRLTLNGALYFIDWENIQGNRAPAAASPSANNSVVVDNIGDAESIGFEIETVFHINEKMKIDAGYAYNEPKLKDGVTYQEARQYYKFGCENDVQCANDPAVVGRLEGIEDVGGNILPRTSKHQFTFGYNYNHAFESGWMLNGRIDASYQSKQYADNLNISWVPSRFISNANISLSGPEHWVFSVWGKNIFDEKYVSSSFMLAIFNRYIVSHGPRRSVGATIKYEF